MNIDDDLLRRVGRLPSLDLDDLSATRSLLRRRQREVSPPDATGVAITDVVVTPSADAPAVTVRLYRPTRLAMPAAILHIHGGGYVVGDLDTDVHSNVALARELGVLVASVDYRLAPEHPFPAALEDVHSAFRWLVSNADELAISANAIAVHGTSAGGGLAAALTLLTRDRAETTPAFQFLAMPMLDDRLTTGSSMRFLNTPVWTRAHAKRAWGAYLGRSDLAQDGTPAYAAPARATDLRDLPPAYICAMQFDPLRDEAIAYATKLLEAGVEVELHLFAGTFHSSTLLAAAVSTQRARHEEYGVLRRALRLEPDSATGG